MFRITSDRFRFTSESVTPKILFFIALLTIACSAALAADIDGKWTAEVQGRGGTQTQTLILKADGSSLTGSLDGGRGGPVDISNGTIDGGNVSFNVVREFNGNQFTQQYKGMLEASGDLKLTVSGGRGGGGGKGGKRGGGGGGREVVFKKAAN